MNRYLVKYRVHYDAEFDATIISTKNPLYGFHEDGNHLLDHDKILNRDIQILKKLEPDESLFSDEYYIQIIPMNEVNPIEMDIDENINQSLDSEW